MAAFRAYKNDRATSLCFGYREIVAAATPRSLPAGGLWSTLLLGDWTPVIRDPVDIIRLSYLAGAVWAFSVGDTGNGVRMLVTFLAAVAPRLVKAPRLFDLFFVTTIGLQAWGNLLGAFHNGDAFDRVDHAMSSLGIAPLFYLWFVREGLLQHIRGGQSISRHVGIVVIGFCIGLSIGAIYEIYEYASDHLFGSGLFINESDTVMDLAMDAVGSLTGSFILLCWVIWGWGVERRLPHSPQRHGETEPGQRQVTAR